MPNIELLNLAEQFLQQNPNCDEALKLLKPGVQIKMSLNNELEASLFYAENKCQLLPNEAKNYDIELILYTEGVRQLSSKCDLSIAEIGIEVSKQVLLGHIEFKKHCGINNIIMNGYLKIIKKAGPEFLSFLAQEGLGSLNKIISFVKKM